MSSAASQETICTEVSSVVFNVVCASSRACPSMLCVDFVFILGLFFFGFCMHRLRLLLMVLTETKKSGVPDLSSRG